MRFLIWAPPVPFVLPSHPPGLRCSDPTRVFCCLPSLRVSHYSYKHPPDTRPLDPLESPQPTRPILALNTGMNISRPITDEEIKCRRVLRGIIRTALGSFPPYRQISSGRSAKVMELLWVGYYQQLSAALHTEGKRDAKGAEYSSSLHCSAA